MINKQGKFRFENNKKELCPFCLGNLKESDHVDCFPKGTIISKKEDHTLIKVSKEEPVIKRMLNISNNQNDNSKAFILLYVDKTLVGYKGSETIKFIPEVLENSYKQILETYMPKSKKKKNQFNMF